MGMGKRERRDAMNEINAIKWTTTFPKKQHSQT